MENTCTSCTKRKLFFAACFGLAFLMMFASIAYVAN